MAKHSLPDRLRPFFWDYDFDALNWGEDRDLIIKRILASGDWNAITWLRSHIGDDSLKAWIQQHQGGGLNPRQLRFWELVFEIPHRQVNAWLSMERRSIWEKRNFPILKPPVSYSDDLCQIASPEDLACMKLSAIAQRGSQKDFLDVYALGLRCISLKSMFELYQKKYSIQDTAHLLYGLSFFDDADKERMPKMYWDVDWRTVKKTIQGWVKVIV
jgi:hypothetical protein